jgi:outer membrane protein
MRKLFHCVFFTTVLVTSAISSDSFAQQSGSSAQPLRVGIVNTKKCLENSKLGKQEQANFEKMKKQMESILQDKESALEDIETKLNDDDYMDSISDETATELRNKKRNLRKDGMALQNQYMQTLQQANQKIVQKLTETISKASSQVAKDPSNGFDIILSDDATTYFAASLDVSDLIVTKMDQIFDQEQKEVLKK